MGLNFNARFSLQSKLNLLFDASVTGEELPDQDYRANLGVSYEF
jgi:hypothetical protein